MARRDQYLESLRMVPLFSQCSKKELTEVARLVTPVVIHAGTTFIREGEIARELMIIEQGEATVKRKGRKLASLGPGAVVGETAVVLERQRNASVTADTDVSMLVIDSRAFGTLLDEVPGFARKILHTVATRLAEQV
jgi:CRP-like cAMP-binding protein